MDYRARAGSGAGAAILTSWSWSRAKKEQLDNTYCICSLKVFCVEGEDGPGPGGHVVAPQAGGHLSSVQPESKREFKIDNEHVKNHAKKEHLCLAVKICYSILIYVFKNKYGKLLFHRHCCLCRYF